HVTFLVSDRRLVCLVTPGFAFASRPSSLQAACQVGPRGRSFVERLELASLPAPPCEKISGRPGCLISNTCARLVSVPRLTLRLPPLEPNSWQFRNTRCTGLYGAVPAHGGRVAWLACSGVLARRSVSS